MATVSPPDARTARHRAGPSPRPPGLSGLPGPGKLWSWALLLVIWAGVPAITALWWQNTIPGALRGGGDYVTAAGRLSGLFAAYLLLVLVALMARVPWLENRVGSDVVARYHRSLGEYTVALAAAHAVLIILGYAWQSGTNPVSEGVTVLFDYPDVLLSAIALALLVLVGVVSARAVRRKLAYETWYHVHLLVYVAIGLAFAHEFAVGADFSASVRNRLLWSAAHIVVGAAVLVFRIGLPLRRSLRHRLRVAKVVNEGPGVVSIHLNGRELDRLGTEGGQFARWRFLAPGLWWQSHPYSISAAPGSGTLRITVKDLGSSSASLARLRPGTRVWFEGPYGAFTARRGTPGRRILLIAGGAGITPIRALFETLPGRGSDVILLYRASRAADLVLQRELTEIARRRGFGYYPLVGPRSGPGGDPLGSTQLRRMVPDLAEREVYLCGPVGMTEAAGQHLRYAGVPRHRIHTEAFEF
ncbi:putative ferric reductase [Kitasatospora sp. MAP12-15]|uniref:ferredoxin reductase family protein n=1 Tax=unclassified Kitasatospora TaxID=2633591 RepID=UPI0024740986|nr:ferric reductase-like transmembrane domain-containing protein [Kitasatospora sp. MAP12-44]MDH6114536.1 putative ferric reductase [Kitasatospora sp. MAP12-44]